jgi:hypothetical protein
VREQAVEVAEYGVTHLASVPFGARSIEVGGVILSLI